MSDPIFWTMVWANFFWFIVSLAVISVAGFVIRRVLRKRQASLEPICIDKIRLPQLEKCPRCQQKLQVCYSCHQPLPEKPAEVTEQQKCDHPDVTKQ